MINIIWRGNTFVRGDHMGQRGSKCIKFKLKMALNHMINIIWGGNTFVRGDHVGQHLEGGCVNTSKPQCVKSEQRTVMQFIADSAEKC